MAEPKFHYIGPDNFSTPRSDAAVDVVFVHGLGGDPIKTWSATEDEAGFWPRWLASDVPAANVWSAGYDSAPFVSALAGEGSTLQDRATSLLDFLLANSLGKRPIVFVTHSLGGLVVKQMLRVCADSSNPTYKNFQSATRAIVFCGTPHAGAGLATVIATVLKHVASKNVKELALSDEALLELNSWFRNWVDQNKPHIRAYHETKKIYGLIIVKKPSADPGIAGCTPIAIDADHIAMCKPATHESQLYIAVKSLVTEIANSVGNSQTMAFAGLPVLLAQTALGNGTALSGLSDLTLTYLDAAVLTPVQPVSPSAKPELLVDYEYFTTQAPHDRRSLAEKLVSAGRDYEVKDAQRKKERFAMALRRHSAQASSLARLTRLMSDVESRFNRHVRPTIQKDGNGTEINRLVQDMIIAPVLADQLAVTEDVTPTLIESSLYYLTGNCHVRWDVDKD